MPLDVNINNPVITPVIYEFAPTTVNTAGYGANNEMTTAGYGVNDEPTDIE